MMRAAVERTVERFDAQPPESVWTTTITMFEIRFGLALLAPGRRRDRLYNAFDRAIDEILGGRVLPFHRTGAERAAANRREAAASRTNPRDPRRPDRRYCRRAQGNPSLRATSVTSKTSVSLSSIPGTRNG
jgi:predicted nucleic acid-binding protein